MELLARLKGEIEDLKRLSKYFNKPDISIVELDNCYYLKSNTFNELSHAEVYKQSSIMIEYLNTVYSYQFGKLSNFIVDCITQINDEFSITKHVYGNINIAQKVEICVLGHKVYDSRGQSAIIERLNDIEKLYNLAFNYENVKDALNLFGNPDWTNLYRILELIGDDLGGSHIISEKGWTNNTIIRRFRNTSQEKRHYKSKNMPDKPMEINEARLFIKGILIKWIEFKGKSMN